ncbi:MAG: T9SS C-terminal target domain-containing protein [Calditrichaeota bacterium]|nr:MAG: T9SS C-terminal target domain-containing protein [Calditrichota bacterium]MBL1204542.1 T9SS C-terminal target domain-containing protein [Calditrichota bacterium]NOG44370.1 T9SS type A sorting domain-containing protein [Calditrichota bacterium]
MRISLIFLLLIFLNISLAQNFAPEPFITIPGNNTNCVLLEEEHPGPAPLYLCWQNINKKNYSIFIQKISPEFGEIITVVSDTLPLINPDISSASYFDNDTIRICWQTYKEDHWQIAYCTFNGENFGPIQFMSDTVFNGEQPKLSINHIAWLTGSKIIVKSLSSPFNSYEIESELISNFDIQPYSDRKHFSILYEAGPDSQKQIYHLEYNKYRTDSLSTHKISYATQNINPIYNSFIHAFQIKEKDRWGIQFGGGDIISIEGQDLENPAPYVYPVITDEYPSSKYKSSEFVVYNSENQGQQDVYIYGLWYEGNLKISQSLENDEHPTTGIISRGENYWDSLDVVVFWEHTENDKTDIWWAKDHFDPSTAIESNTQKPVKFALFSNYPNPFNPTTIINYELRIRSDVKITVYDNTGREIKTLVNKSQTSGIHSVTFNAQNLASGVYYYRIKAGDFIETKKMLLLR